MPIDHSELGALDQGELIESRELGMDSKANERPEDQASSIIDYLRPAYNYIIIEGNKPGEKEACEPHLPSYEAFDTRAWEDDSYNVNEFRYPVASLTGEQHLYAPNEESDEGDNLMESNTSYVKGDYPDGLSDTDEKAYAQGLVKDIVLLLSQKAHGDARKARRWLEAIYLSEEFSSKYLSLHSETAREIVRKIFIDHDMEHLGLSLDSNKRVAKNNLDRAIGEAKENQEKGLYSIYYIKLLMAVAKDTKVPMAKYEAQLPELERMMVEAYLDKTVRQIKEDPGNYTAGYLRNALQRSKDAKVSEDKLNSYEIERPDLERMMAEGHLIRTIEKIKGGDAYTAILTGIYLNLEMDIAREAGVHMEEYESQLPELQRIIAEHKARAD